jgi:RimJ/RimL family protein N-acetyltransferase
VFSLHTERLHLTPHTIDNLERFHAWQNDPELLFYDDDRPEDAEPESIEETQSYLERVSKQTGPDGTIIHYAIHTLTEDAFIGYGMIALINRYHRNCKLGIVIGDRSRWGQGYAREALEAVIQYCFDTLHMHASALRSIRTTSARSGCSSGWVFNVRVPCARMCSSAVCMSMNCCMGCWKNNYSCIQIG